MNQLTLQEEALWEEAFSSAWAAGPAHFAGEDDPRAPRAGGVYYLSAKVLGRPATVRILSVQGGKAQVVADDHYGTGVWVPLTSWPLFLDDMDARVALPPASGDRAVDAVCAGRARYLGRGDDGILFATPPEDGGEVVKASITCPRRPFLDDHRSPGEAARMLRGQFETAEKLRALGVPMVRARAVEHGGRFFVVMPTLNVPDSLGPRQLDAVRRALEGMWAFRFALRDRVQVGLDGDDLVFYDTGKATADATEHDIENDRRSLNRLYEANGGPPPYPAAFSDTQRVPPGSVKVPQVPHLRQQKNWTCGDAALMMVAQAFGVGPDSEQGFVYLLHSTPEHGTSPAWMEEGARRLGLRVVECRQGFTLGQLRAHLDRGVPVICDIQAWGEHPQGYATDEDDGHYVVAVGYDPLADEILFRDPSLDLPLGYIHSSPFDLRWHDREDDGTVYSHWGLALTGPGAGTPAGPVG